MLFYFFSEYGISFFLSLLIIPFFVLVVLASPIFAFHWVFRKPIDREKDYKFIRASSPRLSIVCMVTSLIIIVLAESGRLFENQLYINRLELISVMVAALALVFGISSLQRWQIFFVSFFALVNYFFVWFIVALPNSINK